MNGMKLFRCCIQTSSWGTVFEECIDYIFSTDIDSALNEYRREHGFRKNKAGLHAEPVEYHKSKRIMKVMNEVVTTDEYRYWLGRYKSSSFQDVPHYYCGHCGNEVLEHDQFCHSCDASLYD